MRHNPLRRKYAEAPRSKTIAMHTGPMRMLTPEEIESCAQRFEWAMQDRAVEQKRQCELFPVWQKASERRTW